MRCRDTRPSTDPPVTLSSKAHATTVHAYIRDAFFINTSLLLPSLPRIIICPCIYDGELFSFFFFLSCPFILFIFLLFVIIIIIIIFPSFYGTYR